MFDTCGFRKAFTARNEVSLDDGRGENERGSVHRSSTLYFFDFLLLFDLLMLFAPELEVQERE